MKITFPAFTSSDPELNITYNYRCELYQRHVKETPAGTVITEFLPDVPWAGKYNTISCAASHHFRDGRWMKEAFLLEEYANFWCNEGEPRLYSFPLADSVLALAKVTGNHTAAEGLYQKLAKVHRDWDDHKTENGMYRQRSDRDGMEFSISGDGIRPTINSYQYADKIALGELARRLGKEADAAMYESEAEELRRKINDLLWNDRIGMYGVISDDGVMQDVRELIGYIPWMYGIPDGGKDHGFRNLLSKDCFLSPYGLRTADASHPDYRKHYDHECLWNGPIWPFATAQTLTAIIEYLNTHDDPVIDRRDFMNLMLLYAYSHRDTDGTPWLDENMDPDTGIWLARELLRQGTRTDKERGQHYNHSTFIDLVMTGICGIRPSSDNRLELHPLGTTLDSFSLEGLVYHGHTIDMLWDKTVGLKVCVDGRERLNLPPSDVVRGVIEL